MKDLPIACSLSRAARVERNAGLLPGLARRASGVEALPDGMRLRFMADSSILQEIAAVIETERQCCRFLQFDLCVEQDGGPIALDLTGPSGTRQFLEGLLKD